MTYTVEQPPKNWAQYPKSFLREAIPVLNRHKGNFGRAQAELKASGLFQLMQEGACPVITKLDAIRKEDKTAEVEFEISGDKNSEYFISLSIFDTKQKHIKTTMLGTKQLAGKATVSSDKEEIGMIRLNVRLVGYNSVEDNMNIAINGVQPKLPF